MKKLAIVLLLLQPAAVFAATDKPNPADFTITVHVVSSASNIEGSQSIAVLETIIDNQSVELQRNSSTFQGMLLLGDYPGRLSTTDRVLSKRAPSYEIFRSYDLLMPDGTTLTYTVTRLGPASTNP